MDEFSQLEMKEHVEKVVKKFSTGQKPVSVGLVDIEPVKGFTTVILIVGEGTQAAQVVGNAKRMNYHNKSRGISADKNRVTTGLNVATTRALNRAGLYIRGGK